jgi:hypothetical protein
LPHRIGPQEIVVLAPHLDRSRGRKDQFVSDGLVQRQALSRSHNGKPGRRNKAAGTWSEMLALRDDRDGDPKRRVVRLIYRGANSGLRDRSGK